MRFQKSNSIAATARISAGLKSKCLRTLLMSTIAFSPVLLGTTAWAAESGQRFDIQIGATTVADGLRAIENRTGVSLSFSEAQIANLRTSGVMGQMTVEEALNTLIAGTGLTVKTNGRGAYVIAAPKRSAETSGFMKIADTTIAPRQMAAAEPAPAPQASQAPVEEIVVTGTRIVREGYEAPTPLSVIDTAALENRPDSNLAILIAEMPAFSGSGVGATQSGGLSSSTSGQSNANLRNLGINRTLVLLDGLRTVGSSASGQGVDISSFPQQLVSRVDVVTGGASAVYGSDAVAGVVNFILDKNFTGVKGDISGGMTNYGDGKNLSLKLSAGFGFADNRGHVLISGEETYNAGSKGDGGREWNRVSQQIMNNPAYGTGAGQSTSVPQTLNLQHVGITGAMPGGIVISGPLKGLAFGQGGVPFQVNFGNLVSASQFQGGDWQANDVRALNQQIQKEHRQNIFLRASYEVTDNISVWAQSFWTASHVESVVSPAYLIGANGPQVKIDNAFLPASVRLAMQTGGLTQIQVGSWNQDMSSQYANNLRITNQNSMGFEGNFDAFNSNWKWTATGSYGISRPILHFYNTFTLAKYALAADAVISPTTGAIVCRIKLTDPTNPCQPYNPMGTGVNDQNQAGLNYIREGSSGSWNKIEQGVLNAAITGEPFSVPAGPVSLAISAEHRIESVHNNPDAVSRANGHNVAQLPVLDGKQSVTEGALETVVPLFKGESWVDNWDFNSAVRFTGYELAGYVTTWKLGTTFTPIPDIKFRVTRSRDIRAPNVQELFQPSAFSQGTVRDPVTGQTPSTRQFLAGNPNLVPEKANELGAGVVLAPRFLDGFTASVDYWSVNLSGAIGSVTSQDIIDQCYTGGHPEFCPQIVRVGGAANGAIIQVNRQYFNLAKQEIRGLDVEATYRFQMSDLISSMNGSFTLHGNGTFYLRNFQDDTITLTSNHVGENNGSNGPPNWRMTVSMNYQLEPVSVTLTSRMVSSGVINTDWIECTTGCPVSTPAHLTINNSRMPGAMYFDMNVNYSFDIGDSPSTAYFSVKNMFNKNPPPLPTSANYSNLGIGEAGLYDINGAVFRLGLRFKL